MTIQEAINSGKPIRRKSDKFWIDYNFHQRFYINVEEILADDWEIEEEKIEITRSQLNAALGSYVFHASIIENVSKALGFKS